MEETESLERVPTGLKPRPPHRIGLEVKQLIINQLRRNTLVPAAWPTSSEKSLENSETFREFLRLI